MLQLDIKISDIISLIQYHFILLDFENIKSILLLKAVFYELRYLLIINFKKILYYCILSLWSIFTNVINVWLWEFWLILMHVKETTQSEGLGWGFAKGSYVILFTWQGREDKKKLFIRLSLSKLHHFFLFLFQGKKPKLIMHG